MAQTFIINDLQPTCKNNAMTYTSGYLGDWDPIQSFYHFRDAIWYNLSSSQLLYDIIVRKLFWYH